MTIREELDAANAKLAESLTILDTAKAEVAKDQDACTQLQAQLDALPAELVGKADADIAALGNAILKYFGGSIPA